MFFFVYFFFTIVCFDFSLALILRSFIFVCLVRSVNLIVNFKPIVKLFIFWTSCALKTLLGYVKKHTHTDTHMLMHMRNTTVILINTYIYIVYNMYLYLYMVFVYGTFCVLFAFCCCLDLLYHLIYEINNETTEDYNTTMIIMNYK